MLQTAYNELGDDDSELSALTEDEGDPVETNRNNTRSVQVGGKDGHATSGGGKGLPSSASAAGSRKNKNDTASGATLKSKQNASSGRRKRNSIVPAPMWGWAGVKNLQGPHNGTGHGSGPENSNGNGTDHAHSYNHTSHGSSSHSGGTGSAIEEEEEEEEEFRGPPAMEEEEEDEDNSSGGVPRTSGGLVNGSHHPHHSHGHGHLAAAGAEGEKHGRRAKAHRTALHGPAKGTTRHKGGSGSGLAGDADHTNGSEADSFPVSGEETEEGTHKRSAARARMTRSIGTRKKDRTRGEDGDDDYIGEGNESESGMAGLRQQYKKHTTRKAAAVAASSKKDTPKVKEAAGGTDDAHKGSENDDDDDEGGNGHGTLRKPRSSKRRADFRFMGQGQQTDSDDEYVWHWDGIATRYSSDYPVLKRKRRMTSKEMEARDREKAKGMWIPASRRRPPAEEDVDMESPRDSSPISDINNDEELNDVEMDMTAPSAKEIGHITAAAAASSIMAGSGVIIEHPESLQSSDEEGSSPRSPTPPPKQSAIHPAVTMSKSSPLRKTSNIAIFAELVRSPVRAQTQSPSAARRQAAEALGDLARDVSPVPRKIGNSPGKNKASTASAATGAQAADAMDEDPSPSEPKAGENSLVGDHGCGRRDAEDKDQDRDVEPEADQDVDQDQELPEPEPPEPEQENDIEQEPEIEGEPEHEHDVEQELDIDHDHDEDHDIDGEQDLEVDMLESDLQPAHRAEALDVLASIELKFALLRERVYVEKMDSFAWEEELIIEAVHPELVHLQKELTKRKAKRLELAFKKRDYEIANAKKRRRVDENAVWSWWMNARDELQTEMIAETNRKRRRLERERRALERPLPVRRMPQPVEVHITQPLSIRKIMGSFPFPDEAQDDLRKRRHTSKPLAYPEVTSLSSADVVNDLDFIYQQRRQALNSGLPLNQQHLQPGTQLAPTLYDVPTSLYSGHHVLGPGKPGPGVGIIGPGGISTLPPAVGVGIHVGMNHMGGMAGIGMGIPNGLPPPPGLASQHSLQHPLPPPVSHHGGPPPPAPHSLQQQIPIQPLPSHSQSHTHQHSHHSHPHPSSAPPGLPPSGHNEYHDVGGSVMYGPGGPTPTGRAMVGAPQPSLQVMSQSYQQPPTSMHSIHGVPPRERDRDRDREREREREQQEDTPPFPNSFPGHDGPVVPSGSSVPPSASGSSARLDGHALPGYGHRGDAEYEYEQQQREKDRERERDREREAQRREDIEPSSQVPLPSSVHHSQQQHLGSGAALSGTTHGEGYMLQPYYGAPRDREAHPHAHRGSLEPLNRREGRDVIEGREKDVKGTRDGRDPREGGRRSISPVNVGGSAKQPRTGQYSGRTERSEAVDIDEERAAAKDSDRRDWDRKDERDRARTQDPEREYQQETGKRDYHRQHFVPHQHRHAPPPPSQSHVHPTVPNQHSHHPVGSYHLHHGSHHHHVVHRHHGQSQPPSGSSGQGSPQSGPLRSPRGRDIDIGRPHSGPDLLSTNEVIHLTSSKPSGTGHWKQDDHVERREREKDREMRMKYSSLCEPGHNPPISGRPPSAPMVSAEEYDRHIAAPLVMTSSNAMQSMSGSTSSGPSHGTGGSVSKSGWHAPEEIEREREREHDRDRDRKRERDWERERERDSAHRLAGPPSSSSAPPGYQSSHDGTHSPVYRYSSGGTGSNLHSRSAPVQNHSPRSRQMPPASAYPRSPTRFAPSGSANETSSGLSAGASGREQAGQTMSSPSNLKLQPLLGSSGSTAATGSPKGVGRPFSPYDSHLEGGQSGRSTTPPGKTNAPVSEREREGNTSSGTWKMSVEQIVE